MKFVFHTFLLSLIATCSFAHKSDIPGPSCYVKSTRCCYRYSKCDSKIVVKKVDYKCDYKVCKPNCTNRCHKVKVVTPKLICFIKDIPKKVCTKISKNWYFFSKRRCETKYIKKKVCAKKYVTSHKNNCKKHCSEECEMVRAVCTKYKTYRHNIYCSRLSCGIENVNGLARKPKNIMASTGELINTSKTTRKIVNSH